MSNATTTEAEVLASLAVGHRVWFESERLPYTVQARSDRYVICTKPFAAQRTVLYTIIDVEESVRGADNMVFGGGYETREQCEDRLAELHGPDGMEVSHRNRIPLDIRKTQS